MFVVPTTKCGIARGFVWLEQTKMDLNIYENVKSPGLSNKWTNNEKYTTLTAIQYIWHILVLDIKNDSPVPYSTNMAFTNLFQLQISYKSIALFQVIE